MDNQPENKGFQYTYSAKEQEELKRIREKYDQTAKEEDKMTRLRRLDRGVTQKAQGLALTLGVIGVLLLGLGMSLIMTDLALILGAYRDRAMIFGLPTGLVGCVLVSLAYPVYNAVLKRERKKIAPEMLRLSDELLKK